MADEEEEEKKNFTTIEIDAIKFDKNYLLSYVQTHLRFNPWLLFLCDCIMVIHI